MSTIAQLGSPPTPIIRDLLTIGSQTPIAQISNTLSLPWLTIWNTGSGTLLVGADYQAIGALRKRSFWVEDDDPINLAFAWGQAPITGLAAGQADRQIGYALSVQPLADLTDSPIYETPSLLVTGTTLGNQTTTITPNAAEVYTHIDLAYANAQAGGDQFDGISASYGFGHGPTLLIPPKGSSRQVLEVYGPKSLTVVNASSTARCDWQVFGVANVVR